MSIVPPPSPEPGAVTPKGGPPKYPPPALPPGVAPPAPPPGVKPLSPQLSLTTLSSVNLPLCLAELSLRDRLPCRPYPKLPPDQSDDIESILWRSFTGVTVEVLRVCRGYEVGGDFFVEISSAILIGLANDKCC
ncbi:hypothetical protein JTB14_032206 [Gonioctena quinquepunctata]|nr:hypothetical protein JTB14_032206 [Gonioctena quinquepunctata]